MQIEKTRGLRLLKLFFRHILSALVPKVPPPLVEAFRDAPIDDYDDFFSASFYIGFIWISK
jgi:hypothetical protein